RQHHLARLEAEVPGDRLQRVDRCAVDVGAACLAQAAVARRDAVRLEQGGEACGTAVGGGRLHDLGHEQALASTPTLHCVWLLVAPRLPLWCDAAPVNSAPAAR